jgi:hypothetical protein
MIIQKKTFTIFVAGIILMTGCFLLKNNKFQNSHKSLRRYEKAMSIIDTLSEEMNFDNHVFEEVDFHVFDSYSHRCLMCRTVSDSIAFGWFSGKRNDTIYDIILVLTKDKIIHNIHKKTTFFDPQGRFYYMGDVGIACYPVGLGGVPDSIRVYMDSISPVCADDMDEKFEVDYFPILRKDSITIKFH